MSGIFICKYKNKYNFLYFATKKKETYGIKWYQAFFTLKLNFLNTNKGQYTRIGPCH